ncbi:hypothetical protein [Cyanobium sp. Morenito 9A2]|uniref:hypothetical protein n=1 Tax=Cyanobium sp. Morenito 9A2 TaxID=2823718 RepID=UPI0020CC770E|nr:hypothetical protein [Cyanobium sp. Morenito 9A2]MCP9850404.1 hypothetical protein [Cyanobium sp. Morenito 9A2]
MTLAFAMQGAFAVQGRLGLLPEAQALLVDRHAVAVVKTAVEVDLETHKAGLRLPGAGGVIAVMVLGVAGGALSPMNT